MRLIAKFFRWWIAALIGLLPRRVLRLFNPPQPVLLVEGEHGSEMHLLCGRRGRRLGPLEKLGRSARRRYSRLVRRSTLVVAIGVPEARVVQRTVALPLAAEQNLEKVLSYEIDRLTPFNADEIYYTAQITERGQNSGRLQVALTFTPRAPLSQLAERLADLGLPVQRVSALRPDGSLHPANLMSEQVRPYWSAGRVLAATLCILAVGLLGAWWWVELRERERQITYLQQELALVRQTAIGQAGSAEPETDVHAIAAFKHRAEAVMQVKVLNAVSRLLPDDTSINRLEIRDDRLELSGSSASATTLIGLFTDHPGFRDPAFDAPITRTETDDRARFQISVTLVAGGFLR